MIKKQIEIDVNGDEAAKEIDKLNKSLAKTDEELKDINKTTKKSEKDLEEAGDKGAKGFAKLKISVSAVGLALKALGLGLVIKAVQVFSEVAGQNQKVMDALNVAFEFTSAIFNDIIEGAISVGKSIMKAFTDPKQALKDFGNLVRKNITERIKSLFETFGLLGKSLMALFKGDFSEAVDLLKQAGKESIDIFTGVDNSLEKVTESVSNYASETFKAAKSVVALNKQAKISEVINAGLIEQYDILAENQRQLRDDERETIEDRIEANNKLKEVLEDQERVMLANANIVLMAAEAQFKKNKNDENAIALQEAKNELLGVEAQINGFKSEQLVNEAALEKELKELSLSRAETAVETNRIIGESNLEQIENTRTKIEAQIDLEMELFNMQKELLDERLANEKEGTQAYQDILNERLLLETENNAANKKLTDEITDYNIEQKKKEEEAKLSILNSVFSIVGGLINQNSSAGKALAITQAVINTGVGVTKALAQGGILGIAAGASVLAAGVAQVKNIASTPIPTIPNAPTGGSSSAAGASAASVSAAPNFNLVQGQRQNRLLNDIGQNTSAPARAFVVASDVTTAQELDRNIINGAAIGG